jgi:hypothetical protein
LMVRLVDECKGLAVEEHCRRTDFHAGTEIKLADGRSWTFPAPRVSWDVSPDASGNEYLGLLRAVREAEDRQECCLAELALAIYLIVQNYDLSAAQLESLFTFPPGSQELVDSQQAFSALAFEHVRFFRQAGLLSPSGPSSRRRWGDGCAHLLARLPRFRPIRRWWLHSRNGEAAP